MQVTALSSSDGRESTAQRLTCSYSVLILWSDSQERKPSIVHLHYSTFFSCKKSSYKLHSGSEQHQPSPQRQNNMFPNILCLILYLPLLILAYPPNPRFNALPTGTTFQSAKERTAISAPTGDTLNRTVCFCASPHWAMDQTYGFYYLIKYYNAHLDRTYILEPACQSRISINVQDKYDPKDKPILQNECLRSRFHDPLKYCTGKDTDKDGFCYTLAGGPDYDSWWFNSQHRTGLPLEPEVNYPQNIVEKVCEESCKEKAGGMEMLKGDALEVLDGYYNLVGERLFSSIVFYPSLDDMCEGCK